MATCLLKVKGEDNLLHDHVERHHVLDLAVHQVIFWAGWANCIILRQFYKYYFFTRALLHGRKLLGGVVGDGGPCDFSVSPGPLGF